MSWEKARHVTLAGVSTQAADVRINVRGTSAGGTLTTLPNPLAADRLWNYSALVANITTISGSWTITVEGTVAGVTGFPLARFRSGAATAGRQVLSNLCQSPALVTPTVVEFDNTAAGGITASVVAIAKTYRGLLPNMPSNSYRVVEGRMQRVSALAASRTDTISAVGTTASFMGLDKATLWDNANYFLDVRGISGTWNVTMVGEIAGATVAIATTPNVSGVSKIAFLNNFFGPSLKPTQILWGYVSGAAQGITADVYVIAKTNRGLAMRP